MLKKITVPLMLVSLGIFAATCSIGCGSNSPAGGTGGKADGGGTGGKADAGPGTGGRGTGGGTGTGGRVDSGTDVTGTGGVGTGGRADSGTDVPGTDAGTDTPADMAANDAPADMSNADTGPADAPTDASFTAITCAMTRFQGNGDGTALSAADFCTIYLGVCATGARDAASATRTACEAAYTATSASDGGLYGNNGACKSVHVCNAYTTGNITLHCPHAEGMTPCAP